jgi:hypothetical protein
MVAQRNVALLALAIKPLLLLAADCPAGAKPFPASLAGSGKQDHANLFDITYHETYKVINVNPTLATYK